MSPDCLHQPNSILEREKNDNYVTSRNRARACCHIGISLSTADRGDYTKGTALRVAEGTECVN